MALLQVLNGIGSSGGLDAQAAVSRLNRVSYFLHDVMLPAAECD
jgi:hypothetical protein